MSWELLLEAYRLGYFPMGESRNRPDIVWIKPDMRGVFPLDGFHVPRSLAKTVRQEPFRITLDQRFAEVMRACSGGGPERPDTWINDEIIAAYTDLHERGFAHSVEAWDGEELVGGLYGVSIGSAFFGESMFSRRTDASKVALCHLVGRMKMAGYRLLDTQFQNAHLKRFGCVEVTASRYALMLSEALNHHASLEAFGGQIAGSSILQSITQTS
nr:leucyl/phenylalanyl-tRNA--protein transferase [Parvularcula maris]